LQGHGQDHRIVLGHHLESFIKKRIASGRFSSRSEVILASLRFFEEYDRRMGELRQALIDGEDSRDAEEMDIYEINRRARGRVLSDHFLFPPERDDPNVGTKESPVQEPKGQVVNNLDRITRDPLVMGGRVCARGIRITVGMIVGQLGSVGLPCVRVDCTRSPRTLIVSEPPA
jgi:antitoxin ParD1/3/4